MQAEGKETNMSKVLIILRGLPGSGKSTFANYMFSNNIFEADKYFYDEDGNYNFDATKLHAAHKWCQLQVEHAMEDNLESNGQYCSEIVVSNTSTTEKELEPYLKLAQKYDYKVVSLIVENRHGNKSVHDVPDETIEKMKKRFEIKL
jgi:NEDD4-binding protein 2